MCVDMNTKETSHLNIVSYAKLQKIIFFEYDKDNVVKQKQQQLNKTIQESKFKGIPHCPTCGSPDIMRISTTSKVTNAVLFGLLGNKRNKTFHCNNCKYEW